MAKLVEQLFPSPEIRSSNTVIGEFYLPDEKRKKRPWKAQFFKTAFSMGLIEKMTSVVTRQPDFLQKKIFLDLQRVLGEICYIYSRQFF